MDHWRSHIPKNNPPKQFCKWSFAQGDRKWQQDEQELGFELVDDFFLEQDEVCGCKDKWRGPTWGPRGRGRARRVGAPSTLVGTWLLSLRCSQCLKSSNILEKNPIYFSGHLENFYFRGIFYCTRNSENRQNMAFYFILFN